MFYPAITIEDLVAIQPYQELKKSINKMIIGNMEFVDGIPISAQTGTPVEENKSTWYDRHGLPNPDRPDQILAHREKLEKERQQQREDDLWNKVSKNFKANVEVAKVESFLLPPGEWDEVSAQCVTNFGDVKIGFKK